MSNLCTTLLPDIAHLEEHVRCQVQGRVHDLSISMRGDGLVLRGRAQSYYAKQLAQHAVLQMTRLPILANDIEVR